MIYDKKNEFLRDADFETSNISGTVWSNLIYDADPIEQESRIYAGFFEERIVTIAYKKREKSRSRDDNELATMRCN